MRYGIQAAELKLKLRAAGVQYVTDVKRAVLEQNRSAQRGSIR